ncbi:MULTISPECIES: hypothetical protein [Pseudomonas]|jgi:hypothetical protein|nr:MULTISPECIES: hypothetical protein [Pseudomonas]KPG99141.1 hypothetical protein AK821_06075 [Pseudomonas sp. RIT-PI-r]
MVFSFDRKRGGRIDARVEKLGIIRCEDGLANLSRQLMDMWCHSDQKIAAFGISYTGIRIFL